MCMDSYTCILYIFTYVIFSLEIENKDPNIRLCVHYRHFMAGEFIQDNITKAVKSSKKTVIILSKYAD